MAKTKLLPHDELSQIKTTQVIDTEDSLTTTLNQLENDLGLKSFIYQQINDFAPYITPETHVMVLARDPHAAYEDEDHALHDHLSTLEHDEEEPHEYKYRIAIVLQEAESTIEAEGFGDDVYDAIVYAKQALLQRLIEIHDEVESPQERMNAIEMARNSTQLH